MAGETKILPRLALTALISLGLFAYSASAQEKRPSLGELARRNRAKEKPKAAHKLTDSDFADRTEPVDYPSLGARFALPRGWEVPSSDKYGVRIPCPGRTEGPDDPRFQAIESGACGIFAVWDRMPENPRRSPEAELEWTRDAIHAHKNGKARDLTAWRAFEVAGLPAGEQTMDIGDAGKPRLMRFALMYDVPHKRLLFFAAVGVPENFSPTEHALDTILETLQPLAEVVKPKNPRVY